MAKKEWYPVNTVNIKEFFQSKSMIGYLEDKECYYSEIPLIVFSAKKPINSKESELERIKKSALEESNLNLANECQIYLDDIQESKRLLYADGIFVAFIGEKNNLHDDVEESMKGLFSTYESVREFISDNWESNEIKDENCYYYVVDKYIQGKNGKFVLQCTYIYFGTELYFIDVNSSAISFYDGENLNLPVPYKAGDILEIDNCPFSDKYRVVVLGVGDNVDCCSVTALYKGFDGKWNIGALKHAMLKYYFSNARQLSPLYTSDYYDGPFDHSDDKMYLEIQKYIRNMSNMGEASMPDAFVLYEQISNEILQPLGEKTK